MSMMEEMLEPGNSWKKAPKPYPRRPTPIGLNIDPKDVCNGRKVILMRGCRVVEADFLEQQHLSARSHFKG
jgi:hypothetical protein